MIRTENLFKEETRNQNMGAGGEANLLNKLGLSQSPAGGGSSQQTVTTEPNTSQQQIVNSNSVTTEPNTQQQQQQQQQQNSQQQQQQANSEAEGEGNNGDNDDVQVDTDEISAILSVLGLEQDSENPFTNDTEGLTRAIQFKYEQEIPQLVQQQVEQFFGVNEQTQQLYEHLSKGNTVDSFIQERVTQDFQKYDLKTEDGQKGLIRSHFKSLGLGDIEIDAILTTRVNDGSLKEFSKGIYDVKKQQHDAKIAEVKAQEQQQLEARRIEAQKISQEINSILDKGKLVDFTIPLNEKNEFRNFLYSVDEQGRSLTGLAYNNATREQKMLIDYLLFKGFSLSSNAARANNQSLKLGGRSNNTRQQSSTNNNTNSGGSSNSRSSYPIDFKNVKTEFKPK